MTSKPSASAPPVPATARARSVLIALAVIVGWHVLTILGPRRTWPPPGVFRDLSWPLWVDPWTLAYALVLTLPAPRASGLVVGSLREHWRGVLVVCGGPIALTAIVYPLLPERPWSGDSASMWAISPAAQGLAIFGCAYRVLDRAWGERGRVVARVPVEWPLFLTAAVFMLWHVPNFFSALDPGYVVFQLLYVFVGACFIGLARQWTGSLLYGWVVHVTCNWIAWVTP